MEFPSQHILSGSQNLSRPLRHILVIDDDPSVGTAIQAVMARRRFQTVLASRSSDGIRALQKSSYDVVMLDIFMPGLNGLDALDHIRRDLSIPIIAMSGFRLRNTTRPTDYLAMAAERGATLCMRKPFSAAELIKAVEWTSSLRSQHEGLPN